MKLLGYETLHCDAGWRVFSFLKLTTDGGLKGVALHAIIDGSTRERVDDIDGPLSETRRDPNWKLRQQISRILTSYQIAGRLDQ